MTAYLGLHIGKNSVCALKQEADQASQAVLRPYNGNDDLAVVLASIKSELINSELEVLTGASVEFQSLIARSLKIPEDLNPGERDQWIHWEMRNYLVGEPSDYLISRDPQADNVEHFAAVRTEELLRLNVAFDEADVHPSQVEPMAFSLINLMEKFQETEESPWTGLLCVPYDEDLLIISVKEMAFAGMHWVPRYLGDESLAILSELLKNAQNSDFKQARVFLENSELQGVLGESGLEVSILNAQLPEGLETQNVSSERILMAYSSLLNLGVEA